MRIYWVEPVFGGGGPARKTAIGSRRRLPPKPLDAFKGAPLRLPKPLSDQFPVRACASALCIVTVYTQRRAWWRWIRA